MLNEKTAIAEKLIERKYGGWGCYKHEHPQYDELCKIAGNLNKREQKEAQKRKKEIEIQAKAYDKWWEGLKKYWIRFGKIPKSGKSFNYRETIGLPGVSVFQAGKERGKYHIKADMAPLFTGQSLIDRPAYILTGPRVGTGPDGEPLIRMEKKLRLKKGTKIIFPIIGEIHSK